MPEVDDLKKDDEQSQDQLGKLIPLVFSESSNKPVKKIERYQPMINDLILSIDSEFYDTGQIRIYPEIDPIIEDMKENKIHLVIDGTYNILRIAKAIDNEMFLINAKDGLPLFQSYFVVLKDSEINDLDDLIGNKLALEDSGSTSGYFSPMVSLYRSGLKLDKTEPFSEDSVALYLAGEDELIMRDLLNGNADCGIIPDYDYTELNITVKENLKIIYRSKFMPRSLMLFSKTIPGEEADKIKNYFLSLSDLPEKRTLLDNLSSSQFLEVDEVFSEESLKNLINLTDKLIW